MPTIYLDVVVLPNIPLNNLGIVTILEKIYFLATLIVNILIYR
ncbi:hypothetical protein IMCC1989_222 [gamma proteobacterium IMCC1989]|nr:hypothetical protein IMCC1989_222 [gamma proteobacterium IMCC1989]